MARYDTYGQADDRVVEDLDQGFLGFNNKLRPDLLKAGTLSESNNGRMDLNGEWQPRKGMEIFSTPFSPSVFKLPFHLFLVTIDLRKPLQLTLVEFMGLLLETL